MASEDRTESELLFEALCAQHGIACTRLDVCQDRPQPDYELDFNGQRAVVEVKQIDPNEEDNRFAETLAAEGTAFQRRNPDGMARRVRNCIKKSREQFSSYLEQCPGTPAVLVVFDRAENNYTDPYTIQIAMHGWEEVTFEVHGDGKAPAVVGRGFGRRNSKEVRPEKNQQLSALATLHESWAFHTHERVLSLCFYHNQFASHSFDPGWWHGEHISHMILEGKSPGKFQDWVRLTPKPGPPHGTAGDGNAER